MKVTSTTSMRVKLGTALSVTWIMMALTACDSSSQNIQTASAGIVNTPTTAASAPASSVNTGAAAGSAATSLPFSALINTSAVTLDSEESTFLGLINDYRAQNGLQALEPSINLTLSSRWLSQDMGDKSYFSHTDSEGRDPFTRMTDFNYGYNSYRGENIAAGHSDAQDTFTQWRNSPAHNANMLNPNYRVIGIGRAGVNGSTYTWYWTTDFGAYVDAVITE